MTLDKLTLDEFTEAYIESALWSTDDEDGNPLDCGVADIHPDTLKAMCADCKAFQADNADDLDQARSAPENGHDFWMTRNDHGIGFWHRGLGDVGDRLTAAAKAYGEVGLYASDDGQVRQC